MVSGRDTLYAIEDAADDVQRSIQVAQNDLNEANDKRVELVKQRLAVYRELAELKVNDALYDHVIDESDNLSEKVTALLQARSRTSGLLNTQLETVREQREKAMSAYDLVLGEIRDSEAELDSIAEKAEAALKETSDYADAISEMEQLAVIRKAAEEKAEQAESDRDEKGAAYKSDPLFMYLWRRQYGLKAYEANSVIRMLDNWVADLISYHGARANYSILQQIPEKLEEHLERLGKQAKDIEARIYALKVEKITELAGDDITARLKDLRDRETEQNRRLEEINAEYTDVTAQLNSFSEGRDHSFRQAIEMTAEALEREDFSDLLYEARQTHDSKDDQLVEKLRMVDKELDQLAEVLDDRREELQALFKRKQELQKVTSDFRRKHYDDPGVVYRNNDNMQQLLGMLAAGALTAAEYWARSKRYRGMRSRPADPFRHSSHLPPFGGGWGGHDRDFGGFGGSDDDFDFGDDDFTTGGGF